MHDFCSSCHEPFDCTYDCAERTRQSIEQLRAIHPELPENELLVLDATQWLDDRYSAEEQQMREERR